VCVTAKVDDAIRAAIELAAAPEGKPMTSNERQYTCPDGKDEQPGEVARAQAVSRGPKVLGA
jgi:hypothetical protein